MKLSRVVFAFTAILTVLLLGSLAHSKVIGGDEPLTEYWCFSSSSPSPCTSGSSCIDCVFGASGCRLYYSNDDPNYIIYRRSSDDVDVDVDGYYVQCGLDCNDASASVNPGAGENCGNGVDDDCDGLVDYADGDDCTPDPFAVTLSASASGTTVTLSATTNYQASCRYAEGAGSYDTGTDMASSSPYGSHSATITGVSAGSHTYNVYCRTPR